MRRRLIIAGLALAAGAAAWAATIESIDVERDGETYRLRAETILDASPEAIANVLLDYEQFGRISSVYKEYGYLEPAPDGTPIIFTRMEGCLLFVCKSMTRVERLEIAEPGHIRTVTLPEQSDFRHAVSEWFIEENESGTEMIYTLELEPDFWIPPVIGPPILKRTLRRGGGDVVDRIERLAQAVEAGQGV